MKSVGCVFSDVFAMPENVYKVLLGRLYISNWFKKRVATVTCGG